MKQTRLGSLVEARANLAIGFLVNFTANMLVLPAFGFTALTAQTAFHLGLVYTAISLVCQYVLRRVFNALKFGHDSPVATK